MLQLFCSSSSICLIHLTVKLQQILSFQPVPLPSFMWHLLFMWLHSYFFKILFFLFKFIYLFNFWLAGSSSSTRDWSQALSVKTTSPKHRAPENSLLLLCKKIDVSMTNNILLGWSKISFGFQVKIKDTFFIFTKNFYSSFCSTILCHFSGNFIILSSQNFFIFLHKELFQVPFAVFHGIEIFFH